MPNKLSWFDRLVVGFLNWLCGTDYQPRPEKYEVAEMIDRYLVEQDKYEDGKVIRIKYNGRSYYIVRSTYEQYR
jgi:hypothetical protein